MSQKKPTLIGVSQRVSYLKEINEKRDCLAHDWGNFLSKIKIPWVALPNRSGEAIELAKQINLTGLLLTGGDDIGKFPERDETEFSLLEWANSNNLPVIGVCRGFQVIVTWLGGNLVRLDDSVHCRQRHNIKLNNTDIVETNSYHSYGFYEVPNPLKPLARCVSDSSIEAAGTENMLGIMWHPEREDHIRDIDIELFNRLLR